MSPEPSPDQAALLPLLYDAEMSAGWTDGMAKIVLAMLEMLPVATKPDILEVGCGSGTVVRLLRRYYAKGQVTGLDLNPLALSVAAAHEPPPPNLLRSNLLQLPFADNAFDLLLALDSFDQVGIPLHEALNEAKRVLRSDGILLLRVSAYPWLFGGHDEAFNTGRRYEREEVELALAATGLRVLRTTHANMLLAPPVIAMRMAQNRLASAEINPKTNAHGSSAGIYASPLANRVLGAALSAEARYIRFANAPFGLSLLVAAQKA